MGKLTGPSSSKKKVPTETDNNNCNKNESNVDNKTLTAATTSSAAIPPPPPEEGTTESSNLKDTTTSPRINFNRRQSKNNDFSNSMITAVNNAAQTARLVMQDSTTKTNTLPMTPIESDMRSVSSANSVHSNMPLGDDGGEGCMMLGDDDEDDEQTIPLKDVGGGGMKHVGSYGSLQKLDMDTSNGEVVDSDDDDCFIRPKSLEDKDTPASGSLYINKSQESSSGEDNKGEVPGPPPIFFTSPVQTNGPPMNAFQNLPMTRRGLFQHSHHEKDGKSPGAIGLNGGEGIDEGYVEVTNHFDAAAAISAALSKSHLADATGHNQYSNHHPQTQISPATSNNTANNYHENPWSEKQPTKKGRLTRRRSSEITGADGDFKDFIPKPVRRIRSSGSGKDDDALYRRSFSGGSNEERSGIPPNIETKLFTLRRSSTDNEGEMGISAYSGSPRDRIGSSMNTRRRKRSLGLPTPEEAQAAMLLNRTSFVSVGDDDELNKEMRLNLEGGLQVPKIYCKDESDEEEEDKEDMKMMDAYSSEKNDHNIKVDNTNENKEKIGDNGEESNDATDDKESGRDQSVDGVSCEDDKIKSSDVSLASSSQYSSSCTGFENESNTSSFNYGMSNANSSFTSEMSPISMSTGEVSSKQNDSTANCNTANTNNQKGMLGNLAKARRATLGLSGENSNNSYVVVDDEYSTHSEESSVVTRPGGKKELSAVSAARRKKRHPVILTTENGSGKKDGGLAKDNKLIPVQPSDRKPQDFMFIESAHDEPNPTTTSALTDYYRPSRRAASKGQVDDDDENSEYIAPSAPTCQNEVKRAIWTSSEHTISSSEYDAPSHRVSLFDSFDRNWEQAVQSISGNNPEKVLELGKKCFAAFAIVFGHSNIMFGEETSSAANVTKNGNKNNTGDTWGEKNSPSFFQWWMDDHALLPEVGINKVGMVDDIDKRQGIPIVVIRSLWRACFFEYTEGEEEKADDSGFFDAKEETDDDDNDAILDLIQHILVEKLCYLRPTAAGTSSSSSAVSCLHLSLDVYAEYGWYILRRYGMEDEIAGYHSKLATELCRALFNVRTGSISSLPGDAMIKCRYAAQSLPRHTAIGILGLDSNGSLNKVESTSDDDEKRQQLRIHLFDSILIDEDFIKARIELLGKGNTRPGSYDETLDSSVDDYDTIDSSCVKLAKRNRDRDWNLLFATAHHLKDIEWCASFCCISDDKEAGEPTQQHEEDNASGASSLSLSDCLDAIDQLKEALIAPFQWLHDNGKVTIHHEQFEKGKPKDESPEFKKEEVPALEHLVQLVTCYGDHTIDKHTKPVTTGESCFEVAKSLLAKDDAWTMRDDTSQLFKEDPPAEDIVVPSRPHPPRKGWRRNKRNDHKNEGASTSTPLSRVLGIDINDLRTSVSIARSLLKISEFSQFMLEQEIFQKEVMEESKSSPSGAFSRANRTQCSCLKNAIEILSCTATTLGYILSSSLRKLDEDDLDETVDTSLGPTTLLKLFAMKREAAKPLSSISGILSADAWFALGRLVDKTCKVDANEHLMLFSLERSLIILNSPKLLSLHKPVPGLDNGMSDSSLISPLTQYRCFLQSNLNKAIGVYLYEQGDFQRAGQYLEKASKFCRQMLDNLRGQDGEGDDQGDDTNKLVKSSFGSTKSSYFVSQSSVSGEMFGNIFIYSINHARVLLPRVAFATDELELSLSLTLEYSALTHHADQKYQAALSLFQESLILRTMHVGKHSLDVASLHFNMGVVYDDLEQYPQAISRYHESLRIRLDQRNKTTTAVATSDLEESVLLTLKCMGQVYKLLRDMDNAICCYVKALEMVNKKFQLHREPACEWTKMGLRLGVAVPVPTIILDEMRTSTDSTNWKAHFQTMNKKELCHIFEPRLTKRRSRSTVSKLKRELVKIHLTVVELVNERKRSTWDDESGSSRSKLPGLSLLLASLSSSFKTGRDDAYEAALMRSSFSLGRIRLGETRYEEAADHLETALRSKWVIDPVSSSDSESDFSRKSLSSRKQQGKEKNVDEDDPEEGQIYYALGISNAALDDHERAVRCFLTSLRYLRRSLRKVDSLEVARVLFDCATSYYYLCNFEQSVSLYTECLRILKSYDVPSNGKNDGKENFAKDDVAKSNSFRRGIVLYCLVMAKAAIEFDSEASNLLNEAQNLLASCNDKITLAYTEFLTGLFLHHAASQVPTRLRPITRISKNGLSLNDGLSWNEMCQSALNLFEQVKNECWFDPYEGAEDSEEVKHLPLSGHICFKKGQVYELMGSIDQALNSYIDAANFYRIACGDENVYVASVLHRMGIICTHRTEYHAIGYFNEALSIRKNLLGSNDHLVAETLYSSAVVLARLSRYEASMERYHEALRIQMNDSQDSNEVARTLAGMGICHYNHQAYDLALTCLEGAVKIRKYRVSRFTDSAELVELYGEEVALGSEFFNLGNVHMQMGDYAQAMQCFVQSRDLRWCHVGSGTVDKILDKYFTERTVDEDELLGLAHCLHNIGVMFDIKKEYQRSLPHYEEALAIKNAIACFSAQDSMSLVDQVTSDNRALVFQSLYEDYDFPRTNKATLSAAATRQKIATVYVKQRKYDHALFHFSHALRIQRQVLGHDHYRVGNILRNMGNALRRTSTHSETAIICYNESLRISKLRFGQDHVSVASTMFDIGRLHDSNQNVAKAMHYYQRALSVYKQKYSQDLRQRLCYGVERPMALANGDDEGTEILSTGDQINVASGAPPEKQIREQYALVTEALRKAKHQDMINRGERKSCIGDSNDAWLTLEVLLFRFVEMLSIYIVDPAQTLVRDTIDNTQRRIESAAAHAVISASDTIDFQFLLLMQDN